MSKIFFLIAFLSMQLSAISCGNENYTALRDIPIKNGKIDLEKLLYTGTGEHIQELPYWTHNFTDDLVLKIQELKQKLNKSKDYNYYQIILGLK